jgi:aminoglycoside phosphotransferase (APT) family kinase protein
MEKAQDMRRRLEAYLKAKFPQREELSVVEMDQLTAGVSRENYLVTLSWREAQGPVSESLIIQIELGFTDSVLVDSEPHEFGPQYEVLRRVYGTGIPVPKVYCVEMDNEVLGHPFCVMEKIEGEVLGEGYYFLHPEYHTQLVKDYVEILARIHGLDWQALNLSFLGVPEMDYQRLETAIAGFQRLAEDNQYSPRPVMAEVLTWLRRNMPELGRITLCHGDYHLRNVLARDGRIVALLDWEAVHLGDPLMDLGWSCMFLKVGYESFCDETEFLHAYEEMAGVKVDRERLLFWQLVAALGLMSVGLAGIKTSIESEAPDMRQLWIWPLVLPRVEDAAARLLGF